MLYLDQITYTIDSNEAQLTGNKDLFILVKERAFQEIFSLLCRNESNLFHLESLGWEIDIEEKKIYYRNVEIKPFRQ